MTAFSLRPAMLALAVEQHFGGDGIRKRAVGQWRDLGFEDVWEFEKRYAEI